MAKHKHPSRKKRLNRKSKQTKWAPFWIIAKAFGAGRKMHPSRLTSVKRNWRRNKGKN